MGNQGAIEEFGGCRDVTFLRNEHVNHWALVVYGPIHVPPYTSNFHVRLVNELSTANRVTARTSGIDE